MKFKHHESNRCAEITFRPFCKGDGAEFCRCIQDFYGDGYPYKEYLEESFLLEKCQSGQMLVLCGLTPQGEIVSTSAVRFDEEFTGSGLLLLRVVKEQYRGMGIGRMQEEHLFEFLEKQGGLSSFYADVMTHNTVSQGSLVRRGFVYCGIRLMLYRNSIMVPRLPLAKEGKMSQALMCRRQEVQKTGLIYCPSEHKEAVRSIYQQLGVECKIQTKGNTPDTVQTILTWKIEKIHHSHIVTVQKIGTDFPSLLHQKMDIISRQKDATILCYLNIKDPAALYAYELLQQAGFFFTGLKPLQTLEEYMLLAYIGKQKIRYEDIHLQESGIWLLSYIKEHISYL
ncbi:MAG: GNAT family N-acetyltransferase [Lachnospiraceae bacterium]|nr:GNAT family N-acetyltransferase [Lachnospiraceae bacterium]